MAKIKLHNLTYKIDAGSTISALDLLPRLHVQARYLSQDTLALKTAFKDCFKHRNPSFRDGHLSSG